eukprot:CAMPEP_0197935548 /NCGR_PEP_ID=MMETSP1439-20131203/113506_1 /TAXON_ID=66791 /ORGANISM="Gonyaulax spinifera, Strain CCMP409" /LENGTH=240 /DNA_ID=CAMNT_0043558495 /DNA_START=436 /DNA_END=1154 /DNA_ORIENTATION=+
MENTGSPWPSNSRVALPLCRSQSRTMRSWPAVSAHPEAQFTVAACDLLCVALPLPDSFATPQVQDLHEALRGDDESKLHRPIHHRAVHWPLQPCIFPEWSAKLEVPEPEAPAPMATQGSTSCPVHGHRLQGARHSKLMQRLALLEIPETHGVVAAHAQGTLRCPVSSHAPNRAGVARQIPDCLALNWSQRHKEQSQLPLKARSSTGGAGTTVRASWIRRGSRRHLLAARSAAAHVARATT